MKGPGVDPEIAAAKSEWGEFYKLVENTAYTLPQSPHERRLVVYEKIKHKPLPEEDDGEEMLFDELSNEEKRRWSHYT